MKSLLLSYFCISGLCLCVFAKNLDHENARLFGGAYTKTVIVPKVVTSLVPSSCVQIDASLPPCRSVRYLKFPNLSRLSFFDNYLGDSIARTSESPVHATPLGWGEYLGLYAPTVTVTETQVQVATVQDSRVVVTFAVKGCKPLKLPMDIDRCPNITPSASHQEVLATTSVVENREEIAPSSSIPVTSSVAPVEGIPQGNSIEPSVQEDDENVTDGGLQQPTQALQVTVPANNYNRAM